MSKNDKPHVAIIGSGMAGLACASALTSAPNAQFDISLFEKSRGFSGRMSTRRADGYAFDHGAQYFRAHSDAFRDWLQPMRAAGHVYEWQARAVAISANGAVSEKPDAEPKLVFAPSMNAIGKALIAGRPQVKAYLDCQIERLKGHAQDWHLHGDGQSFGPFRHVVLAIPAAQALALLPEGVDFAKALAQVKMLGCHTLMLGFAEGEGAMPAWDCAHFDDEILGFAAVNSRKPKRGGGDALVIQSNHFWSEAHIETDMDEVVREIKARFADLTGLPVAASGYDRLHRWRYASTQSGLGAPYALDAAMGVSAIGDWCGGGKVEDGFASGWHLAHALTD